MDILDKFRHGKATLADQDEALKDPWTAYWFAKHVKGADIKKCQETVCRDPWSAYNFARDIFGADIEKCQKAICENPEWTCYFACNIPGANIKKSIETCRGTEYEDVLNKCLMEKALL